ncbi:tetratricopeptide repeat protein [Thiocystis violacea]|uniref:tetratricopeptide repeat protein n=1 Tax=Thiocystis violacea TaxID=13725 RepID=UPI0019072E0A|nr:tetratricopeptide repeat protein [Thiocystis violacea]MBK1719249.1 hypothetical protein [Thiocystis violacea]
MVGNKISRSHIALVVTLTVTLTGCASNQSKPEIKPSAGPYNALYEGKSEVAFGTELPASSAAEAIQRGDIAVTSGDLDKGLFHYIRALELDDGNAEALYKIGLIHAGRGNQRLAEMAFRWSLKKDPRKVGSLSGLGILLLKQRNYAEAKQHLELAVSIDNRLASPHNALGVIADLERDYPSAQRHYEQALATNPRSPSVLNNLGYSRYLSGKWKEAAAAFRDALLIDPNHELAWRNLALVYARQKRYSEAIDALAKVQDRPKAYNDVGYIAMVEGKLDTARGYFEEAKRLSPEFYALADTNERRVAIMQGHSAAP